MFVVKGLQYYMNEGLKNPTCNLPIYYRCGGFHCYDENLPRWKGGEPST